MSANSRYRERKYNSSDNDRLLRALSQPVQAWEKKWAPLSNAKTVQTYKWVKSDRQIVFEDDDDEEEEDREMAEAETTVQSDVPPPTTAESGTEPAATSEPVSEPAAASGVVSEPTQPAAETSTSVSEVVSTVSTDDATQSQTQAGQAMDIDEEPQSEVDQAASAVDEQVTHTPKLDDVPDPVADEEATSIDEDSINDPAKNPATNPHVHPNLDNVVSFGDKSEESSTPS